MSESKQRASERQRPVLPDPPYLCATCRHGHMIVQKLQPWLLAKETWQDAGPAWFWQVRCHSPKVTPWKFTTFCHPVVECDGYRAREVLTTEDLARKQAEKAERERKRQKKRKRRKLRNKRKKRKKRSKSK